MNKKGVLPVVPKALFLSTIETVSYTHLDVYKRQMQACDPKDKCAVPFMAGRTADDLKGQKKWTTVSNRMLTHIIRRNNQMTMSPTVR